MLKLKKIKKSYTVGTFTQQALSDLTVEFRQNEFVAVLGPSGSGKTTLLNIVGGLDQYDSGDLIINGKSTKKFKNENWDAYRNNSIGFIFQSYNLITHISILNNVEMGLTLSGVAAKKRRKKAMSLLKKVGLEEHAHKRPNQLSGGQMQRVAIARALANDPDIILADEPTGALDSKTSVQIMNLIKEVSKDKLVIMVTHNADLAEKYANRIIELKDGKLISDSNPITETKETTKYKMKKTAMSFGTALKLSFNNIITKKGRTLLTAFASSIGIIGIALILSLSNGFDKQIDKFEAETISSFPIIISQNSMDLNMEEIKKMHDEQSGKGKEESFSNSQYIYPYETILETSTHENKITDDYLTYIQNIKRELLSGISYTRTIRFNLFKEIDEEIKPINFDILGFQSIPKKVDDKNISYIERNYDLLYGNLPKKKEDILLVINPTNKLNYTIVEALGFDSKSDKIGFADVIGQQFKIIINDNYYIKNNGYYIINDDLQSAFFKEDNLTLNVCGIIRIKEDVKFAILGEGLAYQEELVDNLLSNSINSNIVKDQEKLNYNVLTGERFISEEDVNKKELLLSSLGGSYIPFVINLYPNDFNTKDQITEYLDIYNQNKDQEDKVLYTDLSATISSLSGNIMNAITIVLIAFSSIALVVSSIMIGIITYISVLERTKEIGILRSLGARKKDIARVFNAETSIIGLTSGLIGIGITCLLLFPVNYIIENLTNLPNVAILNPVHAFILIVISLTLTIIGGYIPAIIASKKHPVEALRVE